MRDKVTGVVRLAVLACVAASVAACGGRGGDAARTLPAPAYALDASADGPGRIAVLAGQPEAKGVFVIDDRSGAVLSSFGVTAQADAIAADGEGNLLLGIASDSGGRSVGAVEYWSADGKKAYVLPTVAAVGRLTSDVDGHVYALVGTRAARAAEEIDVKRRRVVRTLPLAAAVDDLQQCAFDGRSYLLVASTSAGTLAIRTPGGRDQLVLHTAPHDVTCATGDRQLYGLADAFASKSLAVMAWPSGLRVAEVPTSVNALKPFVLTRSGDVAVLSTTGRVSAIDVIPRAKVAAFATPPPLQ